MEQTYTQAQLVSFGNFLLSTDRVQDAMAHARMGSDGELDTEFITQVYDADLANWDEKESAEGKVIRIHMGDTLSPATVYDGDEVYARGVVFTNADGSETFVEYGGDYDSSKIPTNTDEHQG